MQLSLVLLVGYFLIKQLGNMDWPMNLPVIS